MNVEDILSQLNEYFSPKVIGDVNDVFVKVAKIKGDELPWHNHESEDEGFFVLEGELLFEEEEKDPFVLKKGDFYVVRKGVNHRVSALEECHILLIENKTTKHTGVVKSDVTKSIEDQLK